jgi:hypothetical protein
MTSNELMETLFTSLTKVKTHLGENHLAYLLLTGTCENFIRDQLAYELFIKGYTPARDYHYYSDKNKHEYIDIALLEPGLTGLKSINYIIELKAFHAKGISRRGHNPYLINIDKDFRKREALKRTHFEVVLLTILKRKPERFYQDVIRFYPAIEINWGNGSEEHLANFTEQLYKKYSNHVITPGESENKYCFEAGQAFNIPVDLSIWIIKKDVQAM